MPDRVASLRAAAKAAAWMILQHLTDTPDRPVTIRARDEHGLVVVSVLPPDVAHRPRRVGQWLSPTCTLVISKLGGDTVTRAVLAQRCGMAYDPKFKTLVTDLIERGIVEDADDTNGIRAVRV